MSQKLLKKKVVGIVEDDRIQQRYWQMLLQKQDGVASVEAWESGEAFFEDERHLIMDLMLVDLELPGNDGLEVIRRIQDKQPSTRCIVLTSSSEPSDVFAAIRAGASGYLIKQASPELLLQNLEVAVQDGMTFSPSIAKLLVQEFLKVDAIPSSITKSSVIEQLTQREMEVLELMPQVGRAKDVGARLGLSHETVRVHMKNVYKKLKVGSKRAAVELLLQSRTRQ